jgi:hypothetical protein
MVVGLIVDEPAAKHETLDHLNRVGNEFYYANRLHKKRSAMTNADYNATAAKFIRSSGILMETRMMRRGVRFRDGRLHYFRPVVLIDNDDDTAVRSLGGRYQIYERRNDGLYLVECHGHILAEWSSEHQHWAVQYGADGHCAVITTAPAMSYEMYDLF